MTTEHDQRGTTVRAPRWPSQVYGVGTDPDPRFTLANERTLLAWVRTGLALQVLGLAAEALGTPEDPALRLAVVVGALAVGALLAAGAFIRWARAERALRLGSALPGQGLTPILCLACGALAAVTIVAVTR